LNEIKPLAAVKFDICESHLINFYEIFLIYFSYAEKNRNKSEDHSPWLREKSPEIELSFFQEKILPSDLMILPVQKFSLNCAESEILSEENEMHSKFYDKCFRYNCAEKLIGPSAQSDLEIGSFTINYYR